MLCWDFSVLLETPLTMTLSDLMIWHCSLDPPGLSLCWSPAPAPLWEWILESNLSAIWQCLMKPFILQSKQHHSSWKKRCAPRPLSSFRLWYFLDHDLLDPKLIQAFLTGSSFPRGQSSLTPSCCSLPSCVGFVTLIHRYDSEFFEASWVNWTHMNGKLGVCAHNGWGKSWTGDCWQKISGKVENFVPIPQNWILYFPSLIVSLKVAW